VIARIYNIFVCVAYLFRANRTNLDNETFWSISGKVRNRIQHTKNGNPRQRRRGQFRGRKTNRGSGGRRTTPYGVQGITRAPKIHMKPWSINGSMPPRLKVPKGPSPGATFTTVQAITNFTLATSLVTSGTGNNIQSFVTTATSASFPVIPFSLGDIPATQLGDFSGIFDQYRFEEVLLRLIPFGATDVSSSAGSFDAVYVVVDLDDGAALANVVNAINYDNVQLITVPMGLDILVEPNLNLGAITGGSTTLVGSATEPSRNHWINLDSNTVPFYGVKMVIPAQTTSVQLWNVIAWYKISFRSTR